MGTMAVILTGSLRVGVVSGERRELRVRPHVETGARHLSGGLRVANRHLLHEGIHGVAAVDEERLFAVVSGVYSTWISVRRFLIFQEFSCPARMISDSLEVEKPWENETTKASFTVSFAQNLQDPRWLYFDMASYTLCCTAKNSAVLSHSPLTLDVKQTNKFSGTARAAPLWKKRTVIFRAVHIS